MIYDSESKKAFCLTLPNWTWRYMYVGWRLWHEYSWDSSNDWKRLPPYNTGNRYTGWNIIWECSINYSRLFGIPQGRHDGFLPSWWEIRKQSVLQCVKPFWHVIKQRGIFWSTLSPLMRCRCITITKRWLSWEPSRTIFLSIFCGPDSIVLTSATWTSHYIAVRFNLSVKFFMYD